MKRKFNAVSLWFTILSFFASVFNFLYYPIVAQFLDLAQFGDTQIGVSFIMQAAALFSSLNLVALYLSAKHTSAEGIIHKLEQVLLVPSILGALLIAIFAHPISEILQLHSPGLLYWLSVIFILNIPASTWVGTLQGEGAFIKSGLISLISSLTKIVASVVFITAGLGAYGAILGILAGSLIIMPLCLLLQRPRSLGFKKTFRLPTKDDFIILTRYKSVTLTLISFILLSLAGTFDILFAKAQLPPSSAGIFAQLSITAKIPYFAFLPVSMILFGRFIKNPGRQINIVLTYTVGVLAMSVITYLLLPVIAQTLFSLELEVAMAHTAAWLLAAFGSYTLIFLMNYLLVSREQIKTAVFMAIATLVLSLTSLTLATGAEEIARNYAVSLVAVMLLSLLCLGYNGKYAKK